MQRASQRCCNSALRACNGGRQPMQGKKLRICVLPDILRRSIGLRRPGCIAGTLQGLAHTEIRKHNIR